jgi:transcriptional regulator with XRE-family HTH domain
MKITGAQIRAARGFLKWSISTLSEQSGVGISTIQKIEDVDGDPGVESSLKWRSEARAEMLAKIATTLENAGVKFLPPDGHGPGIRGKVDEF